MFTRIWLYSIVLLNAVGSYQAEWTKWAHNTTCEEFAIGAQFNPYDVVDSTWKIFYFWSDTSETNPIVFSLPAKKRLKRFKEVVDAIDRRMGVEWHKVTLLMEPRPGVMVLLMHAGTPGAFRALVKQEQRDKGFITVSGHRSLPLAALNFVTNGCRTWEGRGVRPNPVPLLKFADIRMKTEGRYLGMMCCEDLTAFAMVRVGEMPKTEERCEAAAATLGLKGPGGRSFFYLDKKQTYSEL